MKKIKDYPNYSITEDGLVFSHNYNKYLSPFNSSGYLRYRLLNNNKAKNFLAHRLVAEAFITNTGEGVIVNHKDGNKKNNNVSNLEWCTYSENQKHAYDNNLCNSTKIKSSETGKETIKFAQKANQKIVLDTQTGIFYDSAKEAAFVLGINYWNVTQYLSGKRKNKTSLIYA
jgi:hypothetical protein